MLFNHGELDIQISIKDFLIVTLIIYYIIYIILLLPVRNIFYFILLELDYSPFSTSVKKHIHTPDDHFDRLLLFLRKITLLTFIKLLLDLNSAFFLIKQYRY